MIDDRMSMKLYVYLLLASHSGNWMGASQTGSWVIQEPWLQQWDSTAIQDGDHDSCLTLSGDVHIMTLYYNMLARGNFIVNVTLGYNDPLKGSVWVLTSYDVSKPRTTCQLLGVVTKCKLLTVDGSYRCECSQACRVYVKVRIPTGSIPTRSLCDVQFDSVLATQMANCQDVYNFGFQTSGIYNITLSDGSTKQVWCEQEQFGGGWLIFQQRKDGSVDFYQDWADYSSGFGDLEKEFWLGNNAINLLTKGQNTKLKIELVLKDGAVNYADYDIFWIENEAAEYRLSVAGYSGSFGDAMAFHNKIRFSTRDNDNDLLTAHHCATQALGAWWYNACFKSNLNGHYGSAHPTGVVWKSPTNFRDDISATRMMIRANDNLDVYMNCRDAYNKNKHTSGIYNIWQLGGSQKQVWCEQQQFGGGWLVFQQKQDGSVDFQRNWADYKNGFGNLSTEFWLGNDALNMLTQGQNVELKIQMLNWDEEVGYANYDSFWVGDETSKYVLHVGGFTGQGVGDGMTFSNGDQFSTIDQDNDIRGIGSSSNSQHCSYLHTGGWWFVGAGSAHLNNCFDGHLNGLYCNTSNKCSLWEDWGGTIKSTFLLYSRIMIRPK